MLPVVSDDLASMMAGFDNLLGGSIGGSVLDLTDRESRYQLPTGLYKDDDVPPEGEAESNTDESQEGEKQEDAEGAEAEVIKHLSPADQQKLAALSPEDRKKWLAQYQQQQAAQQQAAPQQAAGQQAAGQQSGGQQEMGKGMDGELDPRVAAFIDATFADSPEGVAAELAASPTLAKMLAGLGDIYAQNLKLEAGLGQLSTQMRLLAGAVTQAPEVAALVKEVNSLRKALDERAAAAAAAPAQVQQILTPLPVPQSFQRPDGSAPSTPDIDAERNKLTKGAIGDRLGEIINMRKDLGPLGMVLSREDGRNELWDAMEGEGDLRDYAFGLTNQRPHH